MFTGLVQQRGRVIETPSRRLPERADSPIRLRLGHQPELSERLDVGASLAVNGVCLTLIEHAAGVSVVELSPETLSRTTLGRLTTGSEVNLEPALRLGDALGGHWVQGHVDTTIPLLERRDLEHPHDPGEHRELVFALPRSYACYVVEKGSVTLDGVSLTVAGLTADRFTVAVIPHTLEVTTLKALQPGDPVNLEVDILAKYVQRAIAYATEPR